MLAATYDALGESIVGEELKGDPRAALAVAEQTGDGLGAAVAEIIAGELTAARARLAQLATGADDDALRLIAAFDGLAFQRQLNWFPDGRGMVTAEGDALVMAPDMRVVDRPEEPSADETVAALVQFITVVAMAPVTRAILSDATRLSAAAPEEYVALIDAPEAVAGLAHAPAAWLAHAHWLAADMYHRARRPDSAERALAQARARYEHAGDAAGAALCEMTRGDWLAAPFSGPLALNLALLGSDTAANELEWRLEAREAGLDGADLDGARTAYAGARALLQGVLAPRAQAALTLRDGYLAGLDRDAEGALAHTRAACQGFAACGDGANQALATVHAVLAAIGAGALPEDLESAVAVGEWGARTRCVSYTVGLGVLASRRGRDWVLRRGDYERALSCHRVAEAIHTGFGADAYAIQARVDQGRVYGAVGEAAVAGSLYEEALQSAAVQRARRPAIAHALARREQLLAHDVGLIAERDRDPDRLARNQRRMEDMAATRPAAKDAADVAIADLVDRDIERARTLVAVYRGERAREAGDEATAAGCFAQAEAAAAAANAVQRDRLLGVVYLSQRRFAEAVAAYDRAAGQTDPQDDALIELLREAGGDWQGELAKLRQSRLEERFVFLVRARAWEQALAEADELTALAGPEWWRADEQPWMPLADLATVHERLGDTPRALETYERAAAELEQRIGRLARDELRTVLAGGVGGESLYVRAARAALDGAERSADASERAALQARAFGFVERGKARALLDLIAGSAGLALASQDESALRRRWRELNAQLTVQRGVLAEARLRASGPDAETLAELEAQAAAAEAALRELEAQLQASDPGFWGTVSPRADTLPLDAASALLPSGTVVLQYAFTREDVLAWAIDRDGLLLARHATLAPGAIDRGVKAVRDACEGGAPDWLEAGAPLAGELLEPFDAIIAAHTAVTVVPFGATHALPFGALPWRGAPLAAARPLAVLPSVSVLAFMTARTPAAEPSALAVGNPAAMSHRRLGARSAQPAEPLLASGAEAEYVASGFERAIALVGPAATETAVRTALAGRSHVHFATHGVLETIPLASSLLLADGAALTVYELMGLGLETDLVVLSACRTGQGAATGGDDVVGFVRALLGAGAGSVVVSLWAVDDDSTCLLMKAFYDALATAAPAQALASAQAHVRGLTRAAAKAERTAMRAELSGVARDMLDERAGPAVADMGHPYHWAPFIYVGVQG